MKHHIKGDNLELRYLGLIKIIIFLILKKNKKKRSDAYHWHLLNSVMKNVESCTQSPTGLVAVNLLSQLLKINKLINLFAESKFKNLLKTDLQFGVSCKSKAVMKQSRNVSHVQTSKGLVRVRDGTD